ncbi:hypothetical protein DRN74_06085, partial [Candidatus Micrarchaeota archaeon]
MPSTDGLYLRWLDGMPESLVPVDEKSQLRMQAAEADALRRPQATPAVPPAVTAAPPSIEGPRGPVELIPGPTQPTVTPTPYTRPLATPASAKEAKPPPRTLDEAAQIARELITHETRGGRMSIWSGATIGEPMTYLDLNQEPVAYVFSVVRKSQYVGYAVIGVHAYPNAVLEWSSSPPRHLMGIQNCERVASDLNLTLLDDRFFYLGALSYYCIAASESTVRDLRDGKPPTGQVVLIDMNDSRTFFLSPEEFTESTSTEPLSFSENVNGVDQDNLLAPDATLGFKQLDVPTYYQHCYGSCYVGCGPTAAGTLMGYWSSRGYPSLMSGGSQAVIERLHDLAGTWCCGSATVCGNPGYGCTWWDDIDEAMEAFVSERGYAGQSSYISCPTFTQYKSEIDADRPVVLGLMGSQWGDHIVTGVGYSDDSGQYMIVDPNLSGWGVTWIQYGQGYSSIGMDTLTLSGGGTCSAPSLNSPADGYVHTSSDRTITFNWSPPPDCTPDGYTFRVKTVPDMDSGGITVFDEGQGGTQVTKQFGSEWDNTDLYWSVRACKPCTPYNPGPWAPPRRFRIEPGSPPPSGDWHVEYFSDNHLGSKCSDTYQNSTYVFGDWRGDAPAGGCPSDHFSARFSCSVYFPGGDYTFALGYDDGARIKVDGQTVVDGWAPSAQHYETRNLSSGYHNIEVEYYENTGDAYLTAFWWGPGFDLPRQSQDNSQWYAQYWGNRALWWDPVMKINEGHGFIDHQWGDGGPGYGIPVDRFGSRFERTVHFDCGRWRFNISSDDGVRFWVDDNLILDEWHDQVANFSPEIDLSDGDHQLRLEHYENGGGATIQMNWEQLSACDTTPPTGQITSPSDGAVISACPLTIQAEASDAGSGVDFVEFHAWYDGGWHHLGDDHTSPYSWNWDCSSIGDQGVWLTIHIWDNAGNEVMDPGGYVYITLDRSPSPPSLVSPSNGATLPHDANITLDWNSSSGATEYYAHLWGGPSIDINSGWIGSTDWHIGQLWPGDYHWQVKARNQYGESDWSNTWNFTVAEPATVGPLVYDGHTVDDDNDGESSGDGDGIVECGETIELYVTLRNQGDGMATSVNGAISTSDPYVTWLYNTDSDYPDISGGGTGSNSNDFDFAVDSSTPDGHVIRFDLNITASNGGPWSDSFSVSVACPWPDLVPSQWGGWQYPIVPSSITGTTEVNTLYTNYPTYIDWGITNSGDAECGGDAYGNLYLDDDLLASYNFGNILAGWTWAFFDWPVVYIDTPGWHTLKFVADPDNLIAESDETNNAWQRDFYWTPSAPYADDMESGASDWTATGLWHLVDEYTSPYPESHSWSHSWWY